MPSLLERIASLLGGSTERGPFRIERVRSGKEPEIVVVRDDAAVTIRLSRRDQGARAYRRTARFGVAYAPEPGRAPALPVVDAFVARLALHEHELPEPLLDELFAPASDVAPEGGVRVLRHTDRALGRRAARVVLVNLCEDACGYGPGASEYLRAQLLADPAIAERIELTLLFMSGIDTAGFAEQIAACDPDLVGFSCYSWNLDATARTSRRLRQLVGPRATIVWGGCSFSLLHERDDWFAWWDVVDAVAIGSGERTIVDLVSRLLERGSGLGDTAVRGAWIRAGDRLVRGERALAPRALDQVASPYALGAAFRVPRPYVEMARGCRFECAFCSDARSSREGIWLTNGVERVASDIAAITAWPEARAIDAGASTANVSDAHFADVCEGLRRGDPEQRLSYSLQLYPAIVRPAQREALRGVRVERITLGVQSFTQETWGPMRRKSTLDHMRRAVDVLQGAGPLSASVVLGLPGETHASFVSMLDELSSIEDLSITVNRLLVLPGTQFHAQHERHGLAFDADRFYRVQNSSTMSADDLRRAQEHVLERAARLGRTSRGWRRIDWTNFDQQRLAFEGASTSLPHS